MCPNVAGVESVIFWCILKRLMHVLCILLLCDNWNLLTWFYLYMRTDFLLLLSFIWICLHTMFATWLKRVTLWKQSNMCVVCQLEETTSILLSSVGRGAKSVRLVCHTEFAFCKLYAKCPVRHAWCQRYAYTLAWCRYFYVYQWWQILCCITLYVCTVYI